MSFALHTPGGPALEAELPGPQGLYSWWTGLGQTMMGFLRSLWLLWGPDPPLAVAYPQEQKECGQPSSPARATGPQTPPQAALNSSHCLPTAKAHRSPSVHWQLIWPKRRGGCWITGPRCPPFQSSAGLNRLVVAWLGNQHQLNLKKKQGAEPKPRLHWARGAGCLLTAPGKPRSGATSFLGGGGTGATEPL